MKIWIDEHGYINMEGSVKLGDALPEITPGYKRTLKIDCDSVRFHDVEMIVRKGKNENER